MKIYVTRIWVQVSPIDIRSWYIYVLFAYSSGSVAYRYTWLIHLCYFFVFGRLLEDHISFENVLDNGT